MVVGSQVIHGIYKPLSDLDQLVEQRTKEILIQLEQQQQQQENDKRRVNA